MTVWHKLTHLFSPDRDESQKRRDSQESNDLWLDQEERRQLQEVAERLERVERQLERIKGDS